MTRSPRHNSKRGCLSLFSVAMLLFSLLCANTSFAEGLTYYDHYVQTKVWWEISGVHPFESSRGTPVEYHGSQKATYNGQVFQFGFSSTYGGGVSGSIQVPLAFFNASLQFDTNQSATFHVSTSTKPLRKDQIARFYSVKRFFNKTVFQTQYSDGVVARFWSNGYREYFPYYRKLEKTASATGFQPIVPRLWSVAIPLKPKKPRSFASLIGDVNAVDEPFDSSDSTNVEVYEYAFVNGRYRVVSVDSIPYGYLNQYLRNAARK